MRKLYDQTYPTMQGPQIVTARQAVVFANSHPDMQRINQIEYSCILVVDRTDFLQHCFWTTGTRAKVELYPPNSEKFRAALQHSRASHLYMLHNHCNARNPSPSEADQKSAGEWIKLAAKFDLELTSIVWINNWPTALYTIYDDKSDRWPRRWPAGGDISNFLAKYIDWWP